MRASYLFTSESVSEGHPDKVCDRISDAVVDAFLRAGRDACEKRSIRVLADALRPKHVPRVLGPHHDGGRGRWMHWLSHAHGRRTEKR